MFATSKAEHNSIDSATAAGLDWLELAQSEEGYWAGMLESNCCMEAEWLMAFHVLGVDYPDRAGLVSGILSKQRDDGAWATYFEAPSGDVNTTVESYVALRISGVAPDAQAMRAARDWIHAHDALHKIRVFTRYWLAILGEWPWRKTPNLPPEIIRLPLWFPFNIYRFASWARATLLPLSLLSARRFTRPLPEALRPDELFPEGRDQFDFTLPKRGGWCSWETVFRGTDRLLHGLQQARLTVGRRGAVARCLEWIIRHQEADGSWGGIQPPWIYSLMALHASGYPVDHPVIARSLQALQEYWSYERDGHVFIQACESSVWDTVLSLLAIQECAAETDRSDVVDRAVRWVLGKECDYRGDWSLQTPDAEPGGWAFERANRHYPDIDDTSVAVLVLSRLHDGGQRSLARDAVRRAIDWMLAMQSDNGGWGAFDRNNDTAIITKIPFCDFGEVLDPPSVDVTAHVVEALAAAGFTIGSDALRRAVGYLWSEQEPAGCWFGRWGVNYVYGTAAVLPALAAAGEDMQQARVGDAVGWLVGHQNEDGGWGETCASYMDLALAGRGTSTASQTAWAIVALLATDREDTRDAILRGVNFLLDGQREGSWEEPWYTGSGFPGYGFGARLLPGAADLAERFQQGPELARAFMINYNLYRHYFPLIALGRARGWLARH